MSTQRLLIQVLPAALPEGYRRLIDPDVPLAEPERFLPAPLPGGGWAKLGLGAAIVLAAAFGQGLASSVVDVVQSGASRDWANVGVSVMILAPLLWWIGYLVRRMRARGLLAAQMAQGRYRHGIFLAADALLVYDGKRCKLVPRERIRVERRHADSHGGARPSADYFVFNDDESREHKHILWSVNKDFSVYHWRETGEIHLQGRIVL